MSSHYRICSQDLSNQNDCNSPPLLGNNLFHNSHSHNHPYRQFVPQQSPSISGLNLSSSSSSSSAVSTPPTTSSISTSAATLSTNQNAITQLTQNSNHIHSNSNNVYNNHPYLQHNPIPASTNRLNLSTASTAGPHSVSSGVSSISHQQSLSTPLDGLTALTAIGSSSLHLSSTSSLGTSDLGMSHWLADGSSGKNPRNYLKLSLN